MPEIMTVRTLMLGGVTELFFRGGLEIIRHSKSLSELIDLLVGYKEEGIKLCLKV